MARQVLGHREGVEGVMSVYPPLMPVLAKVNGFVEGKQMA